MENMNSTIIFVYSVIAFILVILWVFLPFFVWRLYRDTKAMKEAIINSGRDLQSIRASTYLLRMKFCPEWKTESKPKKNTGNSTWKWKWESKG